MNIPNPPTGSSALAAYLAKMIRAMRSSEIKSAPGYLVNRSTGGTTLSINIPGIQGSSAKVSMFRFVSSQSDYITCTAWDGSTTGETTYIAKPHKLRGSITAATIDGESVTYGSFNADYTQRTATVSGQSEKQVVVPYYLTNDIVFAAEVDGGTAVNGPSEELTLIDINACARAWARKFDQS